MDKVKNRQRDACSFANINMLGRCNADCYFCLGKDIEDVLRPHKQVCGSNSVHYKDWENLGEFLEKCRSKEINKIYLTGQNTDPSMYPRESLARLISYIQEVQGFDCGIRTNGFLVQQRDLLPVFRTCREEIGYSIHTFNPVVQQMMTGISKVPDWKHLLSNSGDNVRAQVVITRCNEHEFFDVIRGLSDTPVRYIQARRVSTDTRLDTLAPDLAAYERVYTMVSRAFPLTRKFFTDAEEYEMYGKPVVFWRTTKTSVNSLNYFTDGTISEEYFIIEGYLKESKR